jgi:methyltransferase (TIGR00027 family)
MVLVAIEQGYPESDRILIDPLSRSILPLKSRISVGMCLPIRNWLVAKTEQKMPGLWGSIMARKRYIDDVVAEAVGGSVEAVVNLGAGFDTRAFRLPELQSVPVWEVDQPGSIEAKRRRLRAVLGGVPDRVNLVSIDFDHEDLESVLAAHGYRPSQKTIFIWEGVTQYVSEEGVRSTMEYLGKAPAGSRLVFTYVPKDFIDGEVLYDHELLYQKMRVKDQIWQSGLDPEQIERWLDGFGWRVREHVGYDELGERYVKPTGRDLGWMAIERIVDAEKL